MRVRSVVGMVAAVALAACGQIGAAKQDAPEGAPAADSASAGESEGGDADADKPGKPPEPEQAAPGAEPDKPS
ncbi:MAG: hypothetical protein R3C16_13855 [Hyphomonadaceae bacterium]